MVTDEDLLLKLLKTWVESRSAESESQARRIERRKAVGLSAWELMSDPVVTADSTLEVTEAARLMRSHDLRHLLVVDRDGRPTGVVHRADLLSVLLRSDDKIRQDVEDLLARRLRTRADAVGVHVEDGIVVLERRRDVGLVLQDLVLDVGEVEGVVDVRAQRDLADDRWEWRPSPAGGRT